MAKAKIPGVNGHQSDPEAVDVLKLMSLDGRVALVSGAGRGVGRTCAKALALAGAEIIGLSRSAGELASLVEEVEQLGGRARALVCDIRDPAAVAEISGTAGRVDILVNNAAQTFLAPLLETPVEKLDDLYASNARSAFLVSKAVAAAMVETGDGGAIVNVSSVYGLAAGVGRTAYSMSKHALEALTKSLALELAPHGIRANSVALNTLETKMSAPYLADPEFRKAILSRVPLGRLGTPADVVGAVIFLASPAAGWITGATLPVDGGFLIN